MPSSALLLRPLGGALSQADGIRGVAPAIDIFARPWYDERENRFLGGL